MIIFQNLKKWYQVDSLKQFTDEKGKKVKESPHPRYNVEGNNVFFKFKMKASGTNSKTKEKFTQRPTLFDAKKNPINNGLKLPLNVI